MNNTIKDYFEINDKNTIKIYEFLDSCEKIEKIIEVIWKDIVAANLSVSMDGINELFGEFEIALKYIDSINNLKIDASSIFKKFTLLEDAMKIPDYVLIGDILKYEVDVIVKQWEEEATQTFKISRN